MFSEAPILGIALKEKLPSNLEYSVKQISETQLQFDFDLLNRGEKVVLNVLTEKSPKTIEGAIRAKNLSKLNMRDYQAAPTSYRQNTDSCFLHNQLCYVLSILVFVPLGKSLFFVVMHFSSMKRLSQV
ncbi:MAG: hypothetical protein IPO38_11170 [Rhodocyclaceae bacterium]|nr:hypothetical protein [Rhodocyclaceae bacterium]